MSRASNGHNAFLIFPIDGGDIPDPASEDLFVDASTEQPTSRRSSFDDPNLSELTDDHRARLSKYDQTLFDDLTHEQASSAGRCLMRELEESQDRYERSQSLDRSWKKIALTSLGLQVVTCAIQGTALGQTVANLV